MAKLNLFRNYFYGKPGQRDFTEADLPQNRRDLFHVVLRTRMSNLIGVNLLYLLFWLPAVFWTFLNAVQLSQLPSMEAAAQPGFLDQLMFTWLLILFPLVAITGPFNMGVSFVLRNWARDEHSFAFADFKSAVKDNWKQGLLFGLLDGLIPLMAYICARFYGGMAQNSPVFYLPMAIALVAALVWALAAPILPTMIVTYRQKFGGLVRNALIMALATLPRTIGVRLATLGFPILLLVFSAVLPQAIRFAAPVALVLYAVFMLAFNKLIWASHANALCETYLNPNIEGARVNIGLRPRNEDDK